MNHFSIKISLLLLFLSSLSANICSQSETDFFTSSIDLMPQNFVQIYTDDRDGKKYPLVASSDRYWFNANLNFKSTNSDCLEDEEANCMSLGRLYTFKEAQDVCPENWRLPTANDFRNLFLAISIEEKGNQSGIFTFPYTWQNFNSENSAKIKINQNGLKQKKKYISNHSFNIWLRPTDQTEAIHLHGYEHKFKKENKNYLTIFPQHHEKKNSIYSKRKFGVRCVIPINEFNKLTLGNG